ncbi:phage head spike fiber domain-containing protein [Flavobacterium aquaticum]|uniref:phage head spike fiber domain-containing protein n=1 Tax=Flavobacterium aquaticum TaxID=1236486 RepID=UPI0011B6C534|nr:hypothetical protein [Flavobacterium aquaticum]
MKLGNTQIQKAYLGNNLVWEYFNKISNSDGVYSYTKLNQNYLGNCVRIRNEFNNNEQDFGFSGDTVDINAIKTFLGKNQIPYSEDFTHASWNYISNITRTANVAIDPLSGSTADKLIPTSNGNYIGVNNTVSPQIKGKEITISVYAKAGEMDEIWVGGIFGNEASRFNLTSGTIVSDGSNVTSSSIENISNGWYRCIVTYIFQNTIGNNYLYTGFRVATSSANGSDGLFVWGAQLEVDGLTAYQSTNGSRYGVGRIVKMYDQSKKNLIEVSEPTSTIGLAGNVTYESFSGWTGLPFTNCVRFNDGSTSRFIYNGNVGVQGQPLTYSFYIIMDDLSEPQIGEPNDSNADFIIFNSLNNNTSRPTSTKTDLGNGVWRIEAYRSNWEYGNTGIVKYNTQSPKGFRVTGFQCEVGSTATTYQQTKGAFKQTTANSQPYLVWDNDDNCYSGFFAHDLRLLNYSGLTGTTGYTIYNEVLNNQTTTSSAKGIVTIFGGVIGDVNYLSRHRVSSTNLILTETRFGGSITSAISSPTSSFNLNVINKIASTFQTDNVKSYLNGVSSGSDISAGVTNSSNIILGAFNLTTEPFNGFIKETIIYTEPKNNDFLETITT